MALALMGWVHGEDLEVCGVFLCQEGGAGGRAGGKKIQKKERESSHSQ